MHSSKNQFLKTSRYEISGKLSNHSPYLAVHPTKLERSITETQTALPRTTFLPSRDSFLSGMRETDCLRHTGDSSYAENWLTMTVP